MKKLLLLSIVLIGATSAFAQTITFGVKAGVNFSEISASVENITASSKRMVLFLKISGIFSKILGKLSQPPLK